MSKVKTLFKQRDTVTSKLERFLKYVDMFTDEMSKEELKLRLSRAEQFLEEFEQINAEIQSKEDDFDYTIEITEFEKKYYYAIAKAKQLIVPISLARPENNISSTENKFVQGDLQVVNNIRLPTLNLLSFDGQYAEWPKFRDTFDAIINSNATLTDVQKFYYLLSCLKGSASEVVQSLEVTVANYQVAWELLKERYQNEKMTINTHMKAIFELPTLTRENGVLLRKLLDDFLKNVRALKALKQPVDYWDVPLIYVLTNKLDNNTRRFWEASLEQNKLPTVKQLEDFLKCRCQLLETIANNDNRAQFNDRSTKPHLKQVSYAATHNYCCYFCKGSHLIYYCKTFLKLTPEERLHEVRKLQLCIQCLKPNHIVTFCKARSCDTLKKGHHMLLHFNKTNLNEQTQKVEDSNGSTSINNDCTNLTVVTTHALHDDNSYVMLSTAVVNIFDKQNCPIKARVLLDSGSTTSCLSRELFERLGLSCIKTAPITVAGINNCKSTVALKTRAIVNSLHSSYKQELSFLIINNITENLPLASFDVNKIKLPENIELADPYYNRSAKIDALLGADVFYDLLLFGKLKIKRENLALQKTKLGWVMTGRVSAGQININDSHLCHFAISSSSEQNIQDSLEKFWKLEECPSKGIYSIEEQQVEDNFIQNTTRDDSGRFIVTLPIKHNCFELGDSFDNALRRFYNLEARLNKGLNLKKQYSEFMREYLALDHMEIVGKVSEVDRVTRKVVYYIPHHPVFKESSTTTKLRVVFDASAKTSNDRSLNDILLPGPTVQSDLFSILLRFRKYNVVLGADCEKMFRQVWVSEDQRDLLRILWREDSNDPLLIYRLKTVTYGTACATFLSTRCVNQIATEYKNKFPVASLKILKDTYVDDFLSGADDEEQAIELKLQVDKILRSAGFIMRKWCSNSETVLEHCINVGSNTQHIIKDKDDLNTLGLIWDTKHDSLGFMINFDRTTFRTTTKRIILSAIAKIFDPLGLIAPVIVRAKILLQQLWSLKLDWDEPVKGDVDYNWQILKEEFQKLNELWIPRHIQCSQSVVTELHGFCDASETAYGCALYLRSISSNHEITVKLICAKSRVAPVKKVTLPKLELCGALLLAKLTNTVETDLEIKLRSITYWTDSTIVINWLKAQPSSWRTFVANRVAKIQSISNIEQWRHVGSKDNPADIVSRGMAIQDLANSIWWHGPLWLGRDSSTWPRSQSCQTSQEMPETSKRKIVVLVNVKTFDIFEKYSCFNKLHRIITWCLRFVNNSHLRKDKINGSLTINELNNALNMIIRLAQAKEFDIEIINLKKSGSVQNNSKILSLNPFLDDLGILRVGGRIRHGEFDYNKKHPAILPKSHTLTKLIIKNEHLKNLHAGSQAILAAVRENYWPLSGLNTVKGVLRQCLVCFRANPPSNTVQMGNLPNTRLNPTRAFTVTSIDFAGPFLLKDSKFRNKKVIKGYICIFVCFVTKAIHIELVGDLTAHAFLNSLKRFVSRRGIPTKIHTDNAMNFVASNKYLKELHDSFSHCIKAEIVVRYLQDNKIDWQFMPPRTPHFGGLHESAIKSVKIHMKKVLSNVTLTFEDMSTILCQIEAILNSRPLYPCSNDPCDLSVLTPGHFLIGSKLTALPQKEVTAVPYNRLIHFEQLQQLIQHFWNRWSREYVNNLQIRNKWKRKGTTSIKINDLVLIKEDNLPPTLWRLGRVVEIHPGADGLIRVVSVKTQAGVVKRGVIKLCVLPMEMTIKDD